MSSKSKELTKDQKKNRFKKNRTVIFIIGFMFLILFISISNTIRSNRDLPSLSTVKKDLAVRGNIFSGDNFKIATSRKIFEASINTKSLDPDKKDLFITLFSIYTNIPEDEIREKLSGKKRYVVISKNIDQRSAKELRSLAYKLRRLKVFKRVKINGRQRLYGLDVHERGEERLYPYKDTLTPVIGFMKKKNSKNGKQRVNGIKGLEKEFNKELNNMQDGILKGDRDVVSYILFNKDSKIIQRRDGQDLRLTIPLRLQRNIELMLDRHKEKLTADEIIVSVMDSTTGKILSLASSNRYNPTRLTQQDIPNLNVNAIEYQYEPGSIVKPISISIALKHNKIKDGELFYAYNKGRANSKGEYPRGRYKVGRWTIRDDHQFTKHYISLDDVVMFSSNIGTATIANRLSGQEFFEGLQSFGLSKKTGIDLPYEKKGLLHKLYQYRAGENAKEKKPNVFKTTDSYGQGITATFMQMLKAYSVFNNNGIIVTPYLTTTKTEHESHRVLPINIANEMKQLLKQTVKSGTGAEAFIEGLEIGGKTGTANIVEHGKYQKKYMSSFFGFVNDKNHKYTVGVTVNNPNHTGKHWYYYYASHSAVPVFKEITKILIKLNYLEKESD